jgi:hypothetical protein
VIDYAAILTRRFVGQDWTLSGDDYVGLEWLSSSAKPSKKELDGMWNSVQQEIRDEIDARENARLSAITKLRALGLSDEEIAALGVR